MTYFIKTQYSKLNDQIMIFMCSYVVLLGKNSSPNANAEGGI